MLAVDLRGGALSLECCAGPGSLLNESSDGVKLVVTGELPLRALGLAVQTVVFDVRDELTVNIDLVQVTRAVVKVVDRFATGEDGLRTVAERVVPVCEGARLSVSRVETGLGGQAACVVRDAERTNE